MSELMIELAVLGPARIAKDALRDGFHSSTEHMLTSPRYVGFAWSLTVWPDRPFGHLMILKTEFS